MIVFCKCGLACVLCQPVIAPSELPCMCTRLLVHRPGARSSFSPVEVSRCSAETMFSVASFCLVCGPRFAFLFLNLGRVQRFKKFNFTALFSAQIFLYDFNSIQRLFGQISDGELKIIFCLVVFYWMPQQNVKHFRPTNGWNDLI